MSREPIETTYFKWLCAKIRAEANPISYDKLLWTLQNTEYVWLIEGDDNRAEDGIALRAEFLSEVGLLVDIEWRQLPCSVLEMLVAFSYRAEFMAGASPPGWFWEFIGNLDLIQFDDNSQASPEDIQECVRDFVWRTYGYDGQNGGLFPLEQPADDQTHVEIWYQFCAYLEDQGRMP